MRELYMKSGQGFLLVFSITSLSSLHELSELREQIVHLKDDAGVPIVLVGNKSDLDDDRAVSRAQAFALSAAWGNTPYYETSARRRANVNEVFVDVARQIIRKDLARQQRGAETADAERRGGRRRTTTTAAAAGYRGDGADDAAYRVEDGDEAGAHFRTRRKGRRKGSRCTIL
ncbi:Ras-related protein rsr1 [Elasticomyces elasticus]|nr:Ras-related protein rsr1 [Elasticomyces elasticus]